MLAEKICIDLVSLDAPHAVQAPRLVVRKCTVAEIEAQPNFVQLLDEYADEVLLVGLPRPSAQIDLYKQMASVGAFHVFGAFLAGAFVGFATVLTTTLPHYGICVPVIESFFVSKDHRKSGAGLELLNEVEAYVKSMGFLGILASSPSQGVLIRILPNVGYTEITRGFFKCLN